MWTTATHRSRQYNNFKPFIGKKRLIGLFLLGGAYIPCIRACTNQDSNCRILQRTASQKTKFLAQKVQSQQKTIADLKQEKRQQNQLLIDFSIPKNDAVHKDTIKLMNFLQKQNQKLEKTLDQQKQIIESLRQRHETDAMRFKYVIKAIEGKNKVGND
ncbi:hypothetical protein HOL34_00725 [bacterium]|jgi:hypothetical protein|nr:hypothetical protein [bacterium]MBT3903543.1 hypothetical protein [bacterium]MBT4577603.1 hypothetical protein [bacterium]MBT5346139.1 hypothetical protein [bacterium]MBT6131408.1 hypothetical protein [bacterium]